MSGRETLQTLAEQARGENGEDFAIEMSEAAVSIVARQPWETPEPIVRAVAIYVASVEEKERCKASPDGCEASEPTWDCWCDRKRQSAALRLKVALEKLP